MSRAETQCEPKSIVSQISLSRPAPRLMKLFYYIVLIGLPLASASVGDRLPEFQSCFEDCDAVTCSSLTPSSKYAENSINAISKVLFWWDCQSDCNYKCQQQVTNIRQNAGLAAVQFYGKWPFRRVFGVTEFFSTIFSLANFYVNYANYPKIARHYKASQKANPEKATMLFQYVLLLLVSMIGWTCSTIFHIRDFPMTETLDYVGASAISVANFNAVFVRYFGLFRSEKRRVRILFQTILALILTGHFVKLYSDWDYTYNMRFNVFFGISAVVLWILHSLNVNKTYREKSHIYSNSIYLLPHETRILAKLNHIGLSRSKYIPLLPVALNLFLLTAVVLEMVDFEPLFMLIDAHSLWHLCTIFPPIIWYDWNVWDIELAEKAA
ncbi:hypothetical protein OXX79_011548 [Metschnikowia pulcherrima]